MAPGLRHWARDDGMPEPRAMNIAVISTRFIINGALRLVPRSHKGAPCRGHDLHDLNPLWTLDQDTVTRLCREGRA